MASTSEKPESTCQELLGYCLRGEQWPPDLLDRAIAEDDGRAFLSIVVERLGDLFEPHLCETYAALFSQVIVRVCPELRGRIRQSVEPPEPPATAKRVYVLSRVTLGADVAITSVLLDAAKRRYPESEIYFVGSRKSYELFEADPRVRHFPAPYARSGSLPDRLHASAALWLEDGIVIDPDSRLTQLGLISVCSHRDYYLFESRSFGGNGDERLPVLASRWAHEVFAVEDAKPYIAPASTSDAPAGITVSLGVGENPAKRIGGEFESDLLRILAETGASVLVDLGDGADERQRVERALLPGMRTHDGAFAPFASQIARSRLFVGYDSAGGHVASACGVPLISIFGGFVSERMFQRWRPLGTVIRTDHPDIIGAVRHALASTFPR